MWRQFLLDVHGTACNRSVRIPGRVGDHMCWNDSWLDGRYAYTFNRYWLSGSFPKAPVRGGGTDPGTGAYRIPIEHVWFFHGHPYVRGDAFADPVYEQGFLIPTMLESMLDGEIMERRYRPRDRLRTWVGMDSVDPIAVLGYLNDPNEAAPSNGGPLTRTESGFLRGYGLVPDEETGQSGR